MALTSNGLEILRYPEIIEELIRLERLKIDANLKIADDEFLGQFNQAIAEMQTRLYELAEDVYSSFNLKEAEGDSLDALGLLKDIERNPASPSQGNQIFWGASNATAPSGTIVENAVTGDRFVTRTSYQINSLSIIAGTLVVTSVTPTTTYSVSIDTKTYSVISSASPTALEIVTALKAEIDADPTAEVEASLTTDTLNVYSESYTPFSMTFTSNMIFVGGGVLGYAYAEETGDTPAGVEEITKIVTPIPGITSTKNPYAYIQGSDRESDESYRQRLLSTFTIGGKATVPAIRSGVSAVDGVTYAVVVQNNTMVTDVNGIPPKAFRTIVEGGSDADVANAIFQYGGAGIETDGSTIEVVVDEDGQSYQIEFSRPTGVFIAVRVTYSKYDEEVFPTDGETAMRQAIVSHITGLGIGTDVIPARINNTLDTSVAGIGDRTIEVQELASSGDTPNPGSWQTVTLPIAAVNFAQTALIDVTVVEV